MRSLTMNELPPPPPDKTGWPWTEETPPLPESMPDGSPWPRISIVTPSYNQGQFIEETIRSVLLQGYPNLEYIIIDGGSTDNSVEIIKKYEPWLAYWVSEPDRGQSHAINKGWERATGDLLAYLNSDDTYLPLALVQVATWWRENPSAAAFVGAVSYCDESSSIRNVGVPRLPMPAPLDLSVVDHEEWHLPQQSGFWNRSVLGQVGRFLREDLHYTMDRELYYRLARAGTFILGDMPLATYRFHGHSKSISQVLAMYREAPKSLRYITGGGWFAVLRRWIIGRHRIGQGHYSYARRSPKGAYKIWHLVKAVLYQPRYLGRLGFWVNFVDGLGLRKPFQFAWRRLNKV